MTLFDIFEAIRLCLVPESVISSAEKIQEFSRHGCSRSISLSQALAIQRAYRALPARDSESYPQAIEAARRTFDAFDPRCP